MRVLGQLGADLSAAKVGGGTPAHTASNEGHIEVIFWKCLLIVPSGSQWFR